MQGSKAANDVDTFEGEVDRILREIASQASFKALGHPDDSPEREAARRLWALANGRMVERESDEQRELVRKSIEQWVTKLGDRIAPPVADFELAMQLAFPELAIGPENDEEFWAIEHGKREANVSDAFERVSKEIGSDLGRARLKAGLRAMGLANDRIDQACAFLYKKERTKRARRTRSGTKK